MFGGRGLRDVFAVVATSLTPGSTLATKEP